jgi:copper chaperone CopZ
MSREAVHIALAVLTVLLLAAGGSLLAEHLRHPLASPAARVLPAAQAGQRRVTLEVSGMFCANCASRVTRALDATRGVVACNLDVQARRATVVCDRQLADTSLVGAVARAGGGFRAQVVH